MGRIIGALLVMVSLFVVTGRAGAVCGYCGFWGPGEAYCISDWNTGQICVSNNGVCFSASDDRCWIVVNDGVVPSFDSMIAKWKQHEPRFYTPEANSIIQEWKG